VVSVPITQTLPSAVEVAATGVSVRWLLGGHTGITAEVDPGGTVGTGIGPVIPPDGVRRSSSRSRLNRRGGRRVIDVLLPGFVSGCGGNRPYHTQARVRSKAGREKVCRCRPGREGRLGELFRRYGADRCGG
jgi:hypothetical protein